MPSTIHFDFDVTLLDTVQRMLLTTDGTLAELLEAVSLEKLRLQVLFQSVQPAAEPIDLLFIERGDPVMQRTVLLYGKQSRKTYLYADSFIAIQRLSHAIQQDLWEAKMPMNLIRKHHRLEGLAEAIHCCVEPAAELAEYFQTEPEAPLLVRTSRLFCNGCPVTLVSEHLEAMR